MNKATRKNNTSGPSVFRFKAQLFRHPKKTEGGPWILLNLPKPVSKKFLSRGSTKVEGTINGHPFRTALEPNSAGGHWLRVNKAMLNGARAGVGDAVTLAILGPEPEPRVPSDLRTAFAASQKAKALWKELTPMGRRDWTYWIESAKMPETRARRVRRTIEQLSSGKRRACCVNVYEFMLCQIEK